MLAQLTEEHMRLRDERWDRERARETLLESLLRVGVSYFDVRGGLGPRGRGGGER